MSFRRRPRRGSRCVVAALSAFWGREGPGGRCASRAEPTVECLKRCAGPGAVGCPERCAGAEPAEMWYLWAVGVWGACSGSSPLVLPAGAAGRSPGAELHLGGWALL